ncbi:hypothetical protein DFH08DRAFT_809005 [Mycena albidolilacea]|uniref:Uncharacterized protein n=1 Tax=Mycena albidolilacea TaxID=1033008 RepID=A0AAD7EQU7_9AGAR|nr:hypothetical protein DFH08DRAFT_809005 [Mycena albidolilacea]
MSSSRGKTAKLSEDDDEDDDEDVYSFPSSQKFSPLQLGFAESLSCANREPRSEEASENTPENGNSFFNSVAKSDVKERSRTRRAGVSDRQQWGVGGGNKEQDSVHVIPGDQRMHFPRAHPEVTSIPKNLVEFSIKVMNFLILKQSNEVTNLGTTHRKHRTSWHLNNHVQKVQPLSPAPCDSKNSTDSEAEALNGKLSQRMYGRAPLVTVRGEDSKPEG